MNDWVDIEFSDIDLGDKRINASCIKIINRFASQPGASIPKAFNTWSEVKSCYEFFHNGKVSYEKILIPHQKATIERIKNEPVILLPQDTTVLNYTTKASIEDLGNIGGNSKNKGFFAHPLLAITPSRINLGIVNAKFWVREKKTEKLSDHYVYKQPIEEKELFRWIEGYRVACEVAKECPNTQVISIADREGDFAELFEEVLKAQKSKEKYADIIVRSAHDRKIDSPNEPGFENKLRSQLKKSQTLGEIQFTIPATKDREKRKVTQVLKATRLTFKKRHTSNIIDCPDITINAVMAIEENPPEGFEPLVWVFLTTLPINTFDQILLVIDYYLTRWEIEVFFKVLKSGCSAEARGLITPDSLMSLIAIFLVISWRVMYAMKLGSSCPDLSCEVMFSATEWKSVYKVVNKGVKLPEQAPKLGEFVIMVARLGGYLNRKSDPPPGPKAIWIGINRMHDFALAWDSFNENI